MKSLQQIKDEYAREQGADPDDLGTLLSIDWNWNLISQLYAQECVREALRINDKLESLQARMDRIFHEATLNEMWDQKLQYVEQLKQLKGE